MTALRFVLFVVFAVAAPSLAVAQDILPVELQAATCDTLDPTELNRLLALELGLQIKAPPKGANRVLIELTCDPEQVHVAVHDPLTRNVLTRVIPRSPAQEERILALTIAELLDVSWAEQLLYEPPPPPEPPEDPTPPPEPPTTVSAPQPEPTPDLTLRVDVAALGRVAPGPNRLTLGGAVALMAHTGSVAVGLDVQLVTEETQGDAGQVGGALLSMAPLALAVTQLHPAYLYAGAGARLGLAIYSGDAEQGDSDRVTRPWAGPVAVVGAALDWPWSGALTLHVEGGHVLVEAAALADDEPVLAVERQWVTVRVGSGFVF